MISRRELGRLAVGLMAFAVSGRMASAAMVTGTPFWHIRQGAGEVTLLGIGDAQDMSWYSPALRQAFEASGEIWLETAPQDQGKPADFLRAQQYMNLKEGTLFSALEPHLVPRVKTRLAELDIAETRVAKLRPWYAYYQINGGWWAKHPAPYKQSPVDAALIGLAKEQGKPVSYEFPTFPDLAQFLAGMHERAQSQYVEWLLDTQDARLAGENDPFGWIKGRQPERSLERMMRLPGLYAEMQVKRNSWWAAKIRELLGEGKKAFVAIGQLHVMGPAGIPTQLTAMGIKLQLAD
jgi:uncharacterized protein